MDFSAIVGIRWLVISPPVGLAKGEVPGMGNISQRFKCPKQVLLYQTHIVRYRVPENKKQRFEETNSFRLASQRLGS